MVNGVLVTDGLSEVQLRDRIQDLENVMLEQPQLDLPVTQYFCNQVYLREIVMPAGALVTGKIHKHPCLNIIVQGEVEVVTDQGPTRYRAPIVFQSPAGAKRALRVISDCIWITAHHNPENKERTSEEMAALMCVGTYEELADFQHKKLGGTP